MTLAVLRVQQRVRGPVQPYLSIHFHQLQTMDNRSLLAQSQYSIRSFNCFSLFWCPWDAFRYINEHIVGSFYFFVSLTKAQFGIPIVAFWVVYTEAGARSRECCIVHRNPVRCSSAISTFTGNTVYTNVKSEVSQESIRWNGQMFVWRSTRLFWAYERAESYAFWFFWWLVLQ